MSNYSKVMRYGAIDLILTWATELAYKKGFRTLYRRLERKRRTLRLKKEFAEYEARTGRPI